MNRCVQCTVLDSARVGERYLFHSSRGTGTDLCLKEDILSLVISIKDEEKPSNRIGLAEGLGMLEAYKVEKNLKY